MGDVKQVEVSQTGLYLEEMFIIIIIIIAMEMSRTSLAWNFTLVNFLLSYLCPDCTHPLYTV